MVTRAHRLICKAIANADLARQIQASRLELGGATLGTPVNYLTKLGSLDLVNHEVFDEDLGSSALQRRVTSLTRSTVKNGISVGHGSTAASPHQRIVSVPTRKSPRTLNRIVGSTHAAHNRSCLN